MSVSRGRPQGTYQTSIDVIDRGKIHPCGPRRADGTCRYGNPNRGSINYKQMAFNTPLNRAECDQAQYVTRMINGIYGKSNQHKRPRVTAAAGPGIRRYWVMPA